MYPTSGVMKSCTYCRNIVAKGSRCAACEQRRKGEQRAARGGSGWQWSAIRREVLERDGGCVMAGRHEGALEVDHIVPIAQGGTNALANLRTLCVRHHDLVTAKGSAR